MVVNLDRSRDLELEIQVGRGSSGLRNPVREGGQVKSSCHPLGVGCIFSGITQFIFSFVLLYGDTMYNNYGYACETKLKY